jgi:hypothetical protein
MPVEQPVELPPHCGEAPGLDLDEDPGSYQVDHEALGGGFEQITLASIPALEGRVQRLLVQ